MTTIVTKDMSSLDVGLPPVHIKDLTVTFPDSHHIDARMNETIVITTRSGLKEDVQDVPTPVQLFLASIGTCIGSAVLRFCSRIGIDFKCVKIVEHIQQDRSGELESIGFDILVPLDFPVAYQWDMVRVAEKCFVRRSLSDTPEVTVRVVLDK